MSYFGQTVGMKSNKPFPETVQHLIDMEGISQRELTRRLNRKGWRHDNSTLARIVRGDVPATPPHIEAIAAGLGVLPETFVEYRLWKIRRDYDPDVVGITKAVANLRRLEAAEEPADQPLDPEELAAALGPPGNDEAEDGSS